MNNMWVTASKPVDARLPAHRCTNGAEHSCVAFAVLPPTCSISSALRLCEGALPSPAPPVAAERRSANMRRSTPQARLRTWVCTGSRVPSTIRHASAIASISSPCSHR